MPLKKEQLRGMIAATKQWPEVRYLMGQYIKKEDADAR